MNIKQNYKKIIGISLIINVILISLVTVLVLSPTINTFTISSGVYPSAPTYTIWVEDSTYYAKNAYGAIDYSGTNITVIWENVRDIIPLSGGEVFFKAGIYTWSTMMFIGRSNLYIHGEGYGTQFKPSATFFIDNMWDNNTNVLIWIHGNMAYDPASLRPSEAGVHNIIIADMFLDGEQNVFDVINIGANVSQVELYGLYIQNSPNRLIKGTTSWRLNIHNNFLEDARIGIQIVVSWDILITSNFFYGGYYATSAIHGPGGRGNAIYWNNGFNWTISDNVIIGNKIDETTGDPNPITATSNILMHGINGFGGSNIIITNNQIREVYGNGIMTWWTTGNYYEWFAKGPLSYPYEGWLISNNKIINFGHGNGGTGIMIGGNDPPPSPTQWSVNHTIVSTNLIKLNSHTGTTNVGIVLANSPYGLVTGNMISNMTGNGISIGGVTGFGSNYTIVSNNHISNSDHDQTSSTASGGIYVEYSSFVILDSNICTDYQATPTMDYGIRIRGTSDHIILSSNIANPYETVGISTETGATDIKYIGNWNGTAWLSGDG